MVPPSTSAGRRANTFELIRVPVAIMQEGLTPQRPKGYLGGGCRESRLILGVRTGHVHGDVCFSVINLGDRQYPSFPSPNRPIHHIKHWPN